MTTTTPTLAQRKADILRLAQDAVAQRGQRRRARHHALLTLLLTAGVTVLAITLTPTRTPTRLAPSTPRPIAEAPPQLAPAPTIARVATVPGLAQALAVPSNTSTTSITRIAPAPSHIARVQTTANPAQRLTDLQALALLREAGTPAGLIRIEGHTTLVYHKPPTPPGPASEAPATLPSPLLAALPIGRPYRLP
ncbi:MAG: hypothetical protein RIB58_03555 [Phycisphaerales bacterium]